jgi:hypothetical protein
VTISSDEARRVRDAWAGGFFQSRTSTMNTTALTRAGGYEFIDYADRGNSGARPPCVYCGRAETYQTIKGNQECVGCGASR